LGALNATNKQPPYIDVAAAVLCGICKGALVMLSAGHVMNNTT
jgi:hypothetical protein